MAILDFNNKKEVKEYNKFLESNNLVSFTQSLNWSIVKNNWDRECVYLKKDEKIYAGMLILIQKVKGTDVSFMYSPRGPVGDIYNIKTLNNLIKEVDKIAKKYNAYLLTFDPCIKNDEKLKKVLRINGYKTQKRNSDPKDMINPKFEAKLNLEGKKEEDLLKEFSQKTRYNIKLANRNNLKVRHSHNKKDLKIFYDLYKTTTKRDKIGTRPYEYFERMLEAYNKENLRIYIVEYNNEPLSAAISTCYGNELYYVYGASSNNYRNLMPNYLMQMEMIKWGLKEKCKVYNFGGIVNMNKNDGLYRFKTGFCRQKGIEEYIGKIEKIYKPYSYFKLVTLKNSKINLRKELKNSKIKLKKINKKGMK